MLDNHRAVRFYHGKDMSMIASYLNRITHFFFLDSCDSWTPRSRVFASALVRPIALVALPPATAPKSARRLRDVGRGIFTP